MATTVTTTKVTAAGTHDHAHGRTQHHGHDHHDHVHGDMNVQAHERTFDGFIHFLTWNVVAIVAVLIFLALANS